MVNTGEKKTNVLDLIKDMQIFTGLPENQLKILANAIISKEYEPGQTIVLEAERPKAFYVVGEGRVKVYKSSPKGKEQTIYVFGPGEPFCLCQAFGKSGFPANISALEKSRILIFAADILENLAKTEPSLLFNFIAILSKRLKESMQMIESLSLWDLPQRLAAFIVQLSAGHTEATIELSFTHREVAKILGATPEALSRTLKKFEAQGLVETNGRVLKILNPSELDRMAQG